ncbi:5-methyltetrahydropteroyltriglutamate--homocysteine S-methyltransferase [Virgibacillus phasianinus]|uniref:5-methyltetrahydropteroyltriglutamate--homocysteine methyltransferase n=1 Tax=Virgibacillus phasianinus TaxID=2017483 RepID=A0A220U2W3_9BACI|nr:5-methyltetrahydropteroyltriglutamate--homocysteine S-methyltransferase [Virgibacillus phasianinus]ASK62171.1 5-methyltetrahydropteroyltriglutamate--homocysteine S-methyltransferase [Virgibacillus phasianinus]
MSKAISSNLGYPRIGGNREWKRALERFWSGKQSEESFLKEIEQLRLGLLQKQKEHGIELIPVGDFSLYDHVLDTSVMFGIIPERFKKANGEVSLQDYFAIARGSKGAVASSMTKWFNTNYHYIVPELQNATPKLTHNRPLTYYREAKEKLGINGKPVFLGPITFLKLAKGYEEEQFDKLLDQFLPLYETILQELEQEGAEWVQIDEPILATSILPDDLQRFERVYQRLNIAAPNLNLLLQTYFESVGYYEEIIDLPVQGIGLDFVLDEGENLASLRRFGFPDDKVLAAGVIDGRNVWRANLKDKTALLAKIKESVPAERLIVQPSTSLLHVPVTVKSETALDPLLKDGLAFADEKLLEVQVLTKWLNLGDKAVVKEINDSAAKIDKLNQSSSRNVASVQNAVNNLQEYRADRQSPFKDRQKLQEKRFNLPVLPSTSIGSLPQTSEVRKARQSWRKGEWNEEQYEGYVKNQIVKWIDIQEQIGLDVLIHGEFERNDMVEYFGEKLGGFATTKNAWVQSYGSRCVKPPLVYGDVHFLEPMTVKESVFAQSLTNKPVKGMLTGPVTILNWSFVSDHIKKQDVLYQIALALREEVETLEENNIQMIQVDEPALREGLPLKRSKWDDYLSTAVYAFKLATASVQDETQIHTHMCYSEFQDIIDAINDLDADVIAIEAALSHGELIATFENKVYDKGIGLGVYDIHSPRIPEKTEVITTINRALQVLDPKLFWINPDCGLKTRTEEEAIPALEVMVNAAREVREQLAVKK